MYRRLAALAPTDPRAVYLVGVGLLAQGKRAEGRKELEAALALGVKESAVRLPGNPQIQYHLGMVSARVADTRAARQALAMDAVAPTPAPGQPRSAASPTVHTCTHLNRAWTWDRQGP